MKFVLILLANCLILLYSILYLTDHPFTRASTAEKIRPFILFAFALYVSYNLLFIYILKKQKEESGIIYKLITLVWKSINTILSFIQPIQKELLISVLIAAALAIIGMLLAGLPGGALLALLQKAGLGTGIKGDNVWPAASLLSIVWPLCFPVAVLVKHYYAQRGYMGFTGFGAIIACCWVFLLVILTSLFGSSKS